MQNSQPLNEEHHHSGSFPSLAIFPNYSSVLAHNLAGSSASSTWGFLGSPIAQSAQYSPPSTLSFSAAHNDVAAPCSSVFKFYPRAYFVRPMATIALNIATCQLGVCCIRLVSIPPGCTDTAIYAPLARLLSSFANRIFAILLWP